jgi:aspartate aminotransferase
MHGALLVHRVLSSPDNFKKWCQELSAISRRIIELRKTLKEKLLEMKTPGNWDHIVNQIGMFSYTGLNGKFFT